MKQLTFRGFLSRYVRQLSRYDTNGLYKLAQEAAEENARLKAPLLLFALYSGKEDVLLKATKDAALKEHYRSLLDRYSAEAMTKALDGNSSDLNEEYFKVWRSYRSAANKTVSEADTKELMRKKIKRLQEKNGVSNYRIYKDLGLNPGNLNAWLKHGHADKVSLETARKTLRYVEASAAQQPYL